MADAVAAAGELRLVGAMTHFATADEHDPSFLREQLGLFRPWVDALLVRHPGLLVHAANSAATLAEPAARFGMVRCGIAIYGMDPFHRDPADHGLEPALELVSYVAEVKRCAPGQSAGYGRRFVAEHETWLGTVPIGYGDGVRRGLTNNADVLVDGRRVPLVGTVSMDNITVDLGPEPVERGAEAVLIGARDGDRILAEDVAARLGTINYEVTCGISAAGAAGAPSMTAAPLEAAREALAGREAWLVGGAVRDQLLGRPTDDVDVALDGRPARGGADDRPRHRRRRVPALRRVRRLARGRAGPRLARRPRAAARRRHRGRPRRARLHDQRDGRAVGRRRAARPARRARGPRGAARADGLRGGAGRRSAAGAAGRAAGGGAGAGARACDRRGGGRARPGVWAASLRSGCSGS